MFVNKLISASSLLLVLVTSATSAAPVASHFPRGCEVTGFGYNGTNLVVNETGNQAYYLIQNRSPKTIEMQRVESRDAFMSPSLTAKLDPDNWAAMASDISNLHFQCYVISGENSEKVDCRDVLDVCQYPRARFALSNMGNYWVSINKEQRQIINDSVAKGIYLKW